MEIHQGVLNYSVPPQFHCMLAGFKFEFKLTHKGHDALTSLSCLNENVWRSVVLNDIGSFGRNLWKIHKNENISRPQSPHVG